MLEMLSTDKVTIIEKINFEDLDEDEKQAILLGNDQIKNGEYFTHDEIDWDNLDSMDLGSR